MAQETQAAEWPFADPKDQAVFTLKSIIEEAKPILYVVHNADGDWQFLAGEDVRMEDGRIVSLYHITRKDPSVLTLADLPIGWQAWRESSNAPWQREVHP